VFRGAKRAAADDAGRVAAAGFDLNDECANCNAASMTPTRQSLYPARRSVGRPYRFVFGVAA
jgi:hypothetical protein